MSKQTQDQIDYDKMNEFDQLNIPYISILIPFLFTISIIGSFASWCALN